SELLEGDMELLGLMPGASNYTFLARLLGSPADGDPQRLVVYKPRRGEAPLWDFPPGTLCQRETAAFEISEAGGFGFVPPTVLRDFAGEPIAEADRACLRRLAAALQGDLAAVLAELLDPAEVEILRRRVTAALAAEAFPAPGPGRSFPWPPF